MADLAEGIRTVGFRRWYERQLIECHVYFVTGFLSLILVIAGLEEFSATAGASTRLLMISVIAAGAVVCLWSFRRYHWMLACAMRAAERSTCGKCTTYGALTVVRGSDPETAPAWLKVRCAKCGHEWQIE